MLRDRGLYAVSATLLAVLMTILLLAPGGWAASKYKTLQAFRGGSDGFGPFGVIFDQAGDLYGTTTEGGGGTCDGGCGLVYELHDIFVSPGRGRPGLRGLGG